MKNIPPPPRHRRRRRPVQSRRRRRRHRNGCTVTTTFKVINFIIFFLWASPLLKDLQKEISFAYKISSEKAALCRLKIILSRVIVFNYERIKTRTSQ